MNPQADNPHPSSDLQQSLRLRPAMTAAGTSTAGIDSAASSAVCSAAEIDPATPWTSSEGRSFCDGCNGMLFSNQEFHDLYVNILNNSCPDQQRGMPCRTYATCRNQAKICVDQHCPYQNVKNHFADLHTRRHCKAPSKEQCDTFHNLNDGTRDPCWQRLLVWHVDRTCFNVVRNGICTRGVCSWAHDHPEVCGRVKERREHLKEVHQE